VIPKTLDLSGCIKPETKRDKLLSLFNFYAIIVVLPPNIFPARIPRFWLNFLKIFLAYLPGRPQKLFKKFTSKSENSIPKAYSAAVSQRKTAAFLFRLFFKKI